MAILVATLNSRLKAWVVRVPVASVYTVHEVGRIVGQAAPMVYGYIGRGKLAAYKIDGVMHVTHADLLDFIQRYRRLRRSMDAKIKPQRVVPRKKGDPSVRQDFSVPLDYVE